MCRCAYTRRPCEHDKFPPNTVMRDRGDEGPRQRPSQACASFSFREPLSTLVTVIVAFAMLSGAAASNGPLVRSKVGPLLYSALFTCL